MWAVAQGVAATSAPVLLFTDAISSTIPGTCHPVAGPRSRAWRWSAEMVRLNCTSLAERALVPAFVYFFQMLYPFSRVNSPRSKVAAAAGGTVLIRRDALERIGGIEAIKDALHRRCHAGQGGEEVGPIYLGHSGLATSIRPYPHSRDIWRMVSRTAFTQLRYSFTLLLLTLLGLTVVWLVPMAQILFGTGWRFACGCAALTRSRQLHTHIAALRAARSGR